MKRKLDDTEEGHFNKRKNSDLVSMQIEDWLQETQLEENVFTCLETLQQEVKTILLSAKKSKHLYKLNDLSWLSSCDIVYPLKLPFGLTLENMKTSNMFCWEPPERIEMLSVGHMFAPNKNEPVLHMELKIPKGILGSKDFLNFAYHVKRALYLSWVAKLLKKAGFYVEFSQENHDSLRHCLIISRNQESVSREALSLHISASNEFAKPCRFHCKNNNLRHFFCLKTSPKTEENPTPYYNAGILEDLVRGDTTQQFAEFFKNKSNLVKAIRMIRQWLQAKGFSRREDGFNDFLLNAWFMYLYNTGSLSDQTSVVDSLEIFYTSLSKLNRFEKHHSLPEIDEVKYQEYKKFFDFVLLDFTGYFNIAYALSSILMDRLCIAAAGAVQKIRIFSEFENLFLNEEPFSIAYDVYIRCHLSIKFLTTEFFSMFRPECVDSCGNYVSVFKRKSLSLLKRAWGSRVNVFDIHISSSSYMKCNSSSHQFGGNEDYVELIFGAQVLPSWDSSLTRGPPARTSEAQEFRQFWGEKCELRKFADNAICEAIVWDENATSPSILLKISQYILHRHLKVSLPSFLERSSNFGSVSCCDTMRYNVILKAYEKLAQTLRLINDLPLLITNVHPVSSFLRRTSPVPTSSISVVSGKKLIKLKGSVAFPTSRCSPPYLPSVEVHLSMEQSGKWGEDLDAIAHLKTAFYIALAKSLKDKNITAVPYERHLLVFLDTVVFRLIIAYPREVYLMKKENGAKIGVLKDSIKSRLLEREIITRPHLAAYLHSVSRQHVAFSETCRVALYWLSSHMLSDYIDEIIVETIVASVFISPIASAPPRTSYMGFLHFLLLLSTHKWLMKPLYVDFNGEWNETDIEEMTTEFVKLRPVLPPMVVCTPADRSGVRWTKDEPQPLVLNRIVFLAASTAAFLQKHIMNSSPLSLKCLFEPQLAVFDVIIYLRNRHLARSQRVVGKSLSNCYPVCDYDPFEKYIAVLRENFHSVALFFFDKYGCGDRIGVVWRKNALEIRTASISSSLCRLKQNSDGQLTLNLSSVKEDFALLGQELVAKVVSNVPS